MLGIRSRMFRPAAKLLLVAALLAGYAGCKPKIGDDCRISTDCSAAGDRLCDITAPGGYCTVFSCEPGTCPDGESLCVEFGAQRSPLCEDHQAPSPYARTFCMATCDGDSDCRGGYVCRDLSVRDNEWGALLIDTNRGNKACVVPLEAREAGAGGAPPGNDVCDAKYLSEAGAPTSSAAESAQGGAGG